MTLENSLLPPAASAPAVPYVCPAAMGDSEGAEEGMGRRDTRWAVLATAAPCRQAGSGRWPQLVQGWQSDQQAPSAPCSCPLRLTVAAIERVGSIAALLHTAKQRVGGVGLHGGGWGVGCQGGVGAGAGRRKGTGGRFPKLLLCPELR